MQKKIVDVMRSFIVSVDLQTSVAQTEETLICNNLSSLPVVDDRRGDCFGIIGLKDIARFHAEKKNAKLAKAWEICSYRPIEVGPDVTVLDAAALMVSREVHHLVVSEGKQIKGFVSSLDLLKCFLDQA